MKPESRAAYSQRSSIRAEQSMITYSKPAFRIQMFRYVMMTVTVGLY